MMIARDNHPLVVEIRTLESWSLAVRFVIFLRPKISKVGVQVTCAYSIRLIAWGVYNSLSVPVVGVYRSHDFCFAILLIPMLDMQFALWREALSAPRIPRCLWYGLKLGPHVTSHLLQLLPSESELQLRISFLNVELLYTVSSVWIQP